METGEPVMARTFHKCMICGSRGHLERGCPVRELDEQQERMERVKLDDIRLGLKPNWKRR
jgi:hypothetical protein